MKKTFKVFVNASAKFQPAEWLQIGEVTAKTKKAALAIAEETFRTDGEGRKFNLVQI